MNRKKEQIQERQESGKGFLCRRSQADSVARLERKVFASSVIAVCAAPSHVGFVKTPELKRHCFYKKSSGYFIFFPASGYRNYSSGNLGNSGTNGYGWTSTPYNSSNAWNLNFNSGDAYVNNNNRGNGFPVRCVQASAPVFVFAKDTFVFFPASGLRGSSDGKLGWSGSWGGCWTSTSFGSGSAWLLSVAPGSAYVGTDNSGLGLPVRCVQASAAVFAFIIKDFRETPVFFPASGFRNYVDGSLLASGTGGFGWSSTSSGGDAWYFECRSSVARLFAGPRGYDFPVRCVQASAAVWAVRKKDLKQIRYRRESGKGILCRRGQADSVTRLGRKLFANENRFVCAALSYSITLIKIPVFDYLYFYKYSSGYFFFFPAAGIRNYSDGSLRISGGEGDGWTSTPFNSDNAYRFILNSGNAGMGYANRDYGFPVRCVQASAAVFTFTNDTFAFFPASGSRNSNDGKVYGSGTAGYGWASTPNGSTAWLLDFWSTNVRMYYYLRGNGLPVRCVQASASVFVFIRKDIEEALFFFPASGNREYNDGSLVYSAMWGHGWSSSPSDGTNAWFFRFSSGVVHVYSGPRTHGLSVRCVQASAAVFAFSNYLKRRKKAA